MSDAIRKFRGEYGFLSNMYETSFVWDGRTYRNSEAAFQSAKSLDPEVRDRFSAMAGRTAKMEGKKVLLRSDWRSIREAVMEEVVRAKFSQNEELRRLLIETGDRLLVEGNTWHDAFWGVDEKTGAGKNRLGVILMRLRAELAGAEYREPASPQEAAQEKHAERQRELDRIKTELQSLPEIDFTGVELGTKAFGRVVILRQDGNQLLFEAGGAEKRFLLPDCVLKGFLIPDDPTVIETIRRRQELLAQLEKLNKTALTKA